MMYSSAMYNRYAPGTNEQDFIVGDKKTWGKTQTNGIVVCHGSGSLAADTYYSLRYYLKSFSRNASIHIGDLAGQTWGSDIVVTRIGQAMTQLRAEGVTGKIALVGVSMGGCSAFNYAVRYPEEVACVTAIIPLVSLADARSNPWLTGRWPEIDALYGEPPNADYSDHSPIEFVDDLDPDLPIRIWSSTDDGLARPATHSAFVAARPQTEFTSIGAQGHSIENTDSRISQVSAWTLRKLVEANS